MHEDITDDLIDLLKNPGDHPRDELRAIEPCISTPFPRRLVSGPGLISGLKYEEELESSRISPVSILSNSYSVKRYSYSIDPYPYSRTPTSSNSVRQRKCSQFALFGVRSTRDQRQESALSSIAQRTHEFVILHSVASVKNYF